MLEPWFVGTCLSPSWDERTELSWLSYALIWRQAAGNITCTVEHDHLRLVSGCPTGFLNSVVWGGSAGPENIEARVLEVTSSLRQELGEVSVPCEWSIAATQPYQQELQDALAKNGWCFGYEVPGMTCDLSRDDPAPPLHDRFTIEQVRSPMQVKGIPLPIHGGISC